MKPINIKERLKTYISVKAKAVERWLNTMKTDRRKSLLITLFVLGCIFLVVQTLFAIYKIKNGL